MVTRGPDPATTLEDTIGVFTQLDDPGTPVTATEVADELGCSRRTAFNKLETLADRNVLKSKKTGARGRVWWRPQTRNWIDRVTDGYIELDADWRFTFLNEQAEDIFQCSKDDVIGTSIWEAVPETAGDTVRERFQEAMASQEPVTFERCFDHLDGWTRISAYPSDTGLSVHLRDITDREAGEQDIEFSEARYRTLVETAPDAIITVNQDSEILYANKTVEELFGFDRNELIGESITTLIPEPYRESYLEAVDQYLETGDRQSNWTDVEFPGLHKDGTEIDVHVALSEFEAGDERRFTGIFREVTERNHQKRELEEQRQWYQELVDTAPVGIAIIDAEGQLLFVNDTGVDLAGADDADDLVGKSALEFVHQEDQTDAMNGLQRVIQDRQQTPTTELRIVGVEDGEDDIKHVMANSVPITYEGEPASQTVLTDITEQKERQRLLAHHRGQLATLNQLNDIVQQIIHGVIVSKTRDEIEAVVCERFADSDRYCYAWVGSIDRDGDVVRHRTGAGIAGYHEDFTVSIEETQRSQSPTALAARTGETQVARRLHEQTDQEAWQEHAVQYGVHSMMAIPIEYEDSIYGILTVCSERMEAFQPEETGVVVGLGEVIGHALTAIDRRHALVSEQVIELRLQVQDIYDELGVSSPADGRIDFKGVVRTGDETFLEYGSVTGEAKETLRAIAEQSPHFESITFLTEESPESRFELVRTEAPAINTIMSRGARIESAVIEDGAYNVVIHAPPGTDVRELVEAFRSVYPGTTVTAQRQLSGTNRELERLEAVISEGFTDRQREVLKTAYLAGFFNWPRDRKGQEIADSLGIAPSTFIQHVRAAERKLMRAVFADETDEGGRDHGIDV